MVRVGIRVKVKPVTVVWETNRLFRLPSHGTIRASSEGPERFLRIHR